jgi:hypothetical protein
VSEYKNDNNFINLEETSLVSSPRISQYPAEGQPIPEQKCLFQQN